MRHVEDAILRTLLYADVFYYAMRLEELHRYLIHDTPVSCQQIQHILTESERLQQFVVTDGEYFALRQNAEIIAQRAQREVVAQELWTEAERYGRWMARIPFVRMVALTGALAMDSPADEDDDLDYFLITQPGRVWLARLFAVVLVRLVRLRGRELCPNYVLAADKLPQTRHDLFIAHEVTQMIPLYGHGLYVQMMHANPWTQTFLPNACQLPERKQRASGWMKRGLEFLLNNRLGDWLEAWEKRRKQRKFHAQISETLSDAKIDDDQIKGHFRDHGLRVLDAYRQRLTAYDLLDVALPQAGD